MKKTATFFALSIASTLLADCPNGNCGYNQGPYSQNQGYSQGYSQGQMRDGYNQNQSQRQNDNYDNRSNGNYYNNRNDGYDNRNANMDNRGSNMDNRYDNRGSNMDNRNSNVMDNRNNDGRTTMHESPSDNLVKGSDAEILQKAHDVLSAGWMSSGYPNVSYDVNNGNITLRGTVESMNDKAKIEDKIRKLDGVRQVNNQITVTGKNTAYNDDSTATKMRSAEKKYPQDTAATDADRALNAKIRDKLSGWFTNDYEQVVIKTNNGVVTISGFVEKYDDIQKVNDKLKDVSGVKSVNNQLSAKKT